MRAYYDFKTTKGMALLFPHPTQGKKNRAARRGEMNDIQIFNRIFRKPSCKCFSAGDGIARCNL